MGTRLRYRHEVRQKGRVGTRTRTRIRTLDTEFSHTLIQQQREVCVRVRVRGLRTCARTCTCSRNLLYPAIVLSPWLYMARQKAPLARSINSSPSFALPSLADDDPCARQPSRCLARLQVACGARRFTSSHWASSSVARGNHS